MKNMGINAQIALSMAFAAALVTFLVGEYERRSETERMNANLNVQADLTVSLITGLMMESIIVQDTPVLETAMEEALLRNSKLLALSIKDDAGDVIASAERNSLQSTAAVRHIVRYIIFEGEPFGLMEIDWSSAEGQAQIDVNVSRTRFIIAMTAAVLSLLVLLQTNILALQPLRNIHSRMSAVITGRHHKETPLASFVSREFVALDQSVSVLQNTFAERDEREHALEIAKENADKASRAKS